MQHAVAEEYLPLNAERQHELEMLFSKAENNDADAQYELGKIFEYGYKVDENKEEAYFWYSRALKTMQPVFSSLIEEANQGSYGAKTRICERLTLQNEAGALHACASYAEAGHNDAIVRMCENSMSAYITEENISAGAKWCLPAAVTCGSQLSEGYLGILYQHGLGVKKNNEYAYFLFSRNAIKEGFMEYFKALKKVARENISKERADEIDLIAAQATSIVPDIAPIEVKSLKSSSFTCSGPRLWYFSKEKDQETDKDKERAKEAKILLRKVNLHLTAQEYDSAHRRLKENKPRKELLYISPIPDVAALRQKTENGDSEAEWQLAKLYIWGKGVPKSENDAFEWARKAAEKGNSEAQLHVASTYGWRERTPENMSTSAKWVLKAAANGNTFAKYVAGGFYARGESEIHENGIKQDWAEAVRWYREAADEGNVEAFGALGAAYYAGDGLSQDFEQAFFWLSLYSNAPRETKWPIPPILMLDAGLRLTEAQREAVAERVKNWHPRLTPNLHKE